MKRISGIACTAALFFVGASGSGGEPTPDLSEQAPYRPGPNDAITDVPGVKVGHYTHTEGTMRGVTVVIAGETGGTCGVEVRGSNPGTLNLDTFDPVNIGEECEAILLTGGSLFALDTVPGVMDYLIERGRTV